MGLWTKGIPNQLNRPLTAFEHSVGFALTANSPNNMIPRVVLQEGTVNLSIREIEYEDETIFRSFGIHVFVGSPVDGTGG
jgi:hypothetical protein